MLDVKTQLVSALSTILPTYYEYFCDSTTEKPCITYVETNNYDYKVGDTFGYSTVEFTIKIWGYSINDLTGYAQQVDSVMRNLGYTRTSSNELVVNNQIEKVLTYTALGIENFD